MVMLPVFKFLLLFLIVPFLFSTFTKTGLLTRLGDKMQYHLFLRMALMAVKQPVFDIIPGISVIGRLAEGYNALQARVHKLRSPFPA
jgi:hypothetical protein